MRNHVISLLVAGVTSLAMTGCAGKKPSNDAQTHIDNAYELAGDTFMKNTVDLQCTDAINPMDFFKDASVPPAMQLFDNVYFVGVSSVTAWAIKTSEGIILIDALHNADEAKTVIEPGLKKFGLNPADIKYIVVTHGHGDHFGGAHYLAETYGSRVLMTKSDWDLALNPPPRPDRPGMQAPPKTQAPNVDMVATDGQELVLGDASMTIVTTPGHTLGTISVVFSAKHNGEEHKVGLWGGTGIPRDPALMQAYSASADKFAAILKDLGADTVLSNHPFVDGSIARMEKIPAAGSEHPFVIGEANVQKFIQILGECARARAAKP